MLNNNQLSGEIPPEVGQLTHLVYLNIANNQLSGHIPPELTNIRNLEKLYLNHNRLTGQVPPEFSTLTKLQDYSLEGNQLTGTIIPQALPQTGADKISPWILISIGILFLLAGSVIYAQGAKKTNE
jgi:LPXTG-motif cell wall-anchored protein